MTLLNPPLDMQNRTDHSAQGDRQFIKELWRFSGIGSVGDLLVAAQGTPNMTVAVAAGVAIMQGSESANQGTYLGMNDASINVTITAAHATLPRIDLIVARVQDQAYSGTNNFWEIVAVAGTPAGSPVAPAPGNNALTLAQIAVGAAVTSITNANITNIATPARMYQSRYQLVSSSDVFQWYDSAGVLLAAIDTTGHVKAFGTTGGSAKTRKPMCRVETTSFSIPASTPTKLPFAAAGVQYDTDSMFVDASDWLIINTAGIYRVTAGIAFTWSSSGTYRACGIVKNNTTELVRNGDDLPATNGLTADRVVSITLPCNVADTFYNKVFHTAATALGPAAAGIGYDKSNFLEAEWLAPLS